MCQGAYEKIIMDNKQNIRIVDIAKMAKVSVGTVDRVLHNRGRVSEEKREAVNKVLKEINYEPNMVARFLASRKSFSFAVLIPSFLSGEYWELVHSGIEKAASELKDFNVNIDYIYFNQFDSQSFILASQKLFCTEYAGAIIATLHKEKVIQLASQLDAIELPYVFIDSNIEACNNLSYFGANSVISGEIAAKLMLKEIGKSGDIIIVDGNYSQDAISTQIENREKGFLLYLSDNEHVGRVNRIPLSTGNFVSFVSQLEKMINNKAKTGIIIFNSRIHEVATLTDCFTIPQNSVYLIGYDTIERNVQALLANKVSYLISQRSILQGYESIKALSNYLIFDSTPLKENYMPIDILIRENISFYCD